MVYQYFYCVTQLRLDGRPITPLLAGTRVLPSIADRNQKPVLLFRIRMSALPSPVKSSDCCSTQLNLAGILTTPLSVGSYIFRYLPPYTYHYIFRTR